MTASLGRWEYELGKLCYLYSILKLSEKYEVFISELQKTSEMLKVHLSLFLTELMKKCFTVLLLGKLSGRVCNISIFLTCLFYQPHPQTPEARCLTLI